MAARATASELKDAVIQVLDAGGGVQDEIPVLFNPTEYSVDKSVSYDDQNLPGLTSPLTQFGSGDAETLSMELFFDTYEKDNPTDVREYTDRLDSLLAVDPDIHAPPVCRFVWGSLNFKSVLQDASKQFTMFLADGIPVRARVNVTFKEYNPPWEQTAETPRQSADKTKVWRVTEADTLWLIAAKEYGDPQEWRLIADANGITNPRTLAPGRELVIPRGRDE